MPGRTTWCWPYKRDSSGSSLMVSNLPPLKSPSSPLINATTKSPVLVTSTKHQAWVHLQNKYMQWLESDLAAMGLMRGAIEFGQREHIQTATTSKEMWDKLRQLHVTQ